MRWNFSILVLTISLLLVATIGSAYVTFRAFNRNVATEGSVAASAEAGAGEAAVPDRAPTSRPGQVFEIGEFTADLAAGTLPGTSYIRVRVYVEADSSRTVREIEDRMAQVRDRILAVLRQQQSADVKGAPGFARLKLDLLTALNELLVTGSVREVLLTEMVVQ